MPVSRKVVNYLLDRTTSPNAPSLRNLLGTAVLAILAGHQRYAHINGLRGDTLNPPLLGMTKVVSEDSVRGNFSKIDEARGCCGCNSTWTPLPCLS